MSINQSCWEFFFWYLKQSRCFDHVTDKQPNWTDLWLIPILKSERSSVITSYNNLKTSMFKSWIIGLLTPCYLLYRHIFHQFSCEVKISCYLWTSEQWQEAAISWQHIIMTAAGKSWTQINITVCGWLNSLYMLLVMLCVCWWRLMLVMCYLQ